LVDREAFASDVEEANQNCFQIKLTMKIHSRATNWILTLSLASATAISANAITPTQKPLASNEERGPRVTLIADKADELSTLEQAYVILARADKDYDGHRAKAMKQIKEASKLMGVKFHGEGKGHERQSVSDAQLREAQAMLEKTSGELQANKQERPLKHVNAAIREVSEALRVR
jgi:hypothetical protein